MNVKYRASLALAMLTLSLAGCPLNGPGGYTGWVYDLNESDFGHSIHETSEGNLLVIGESGPERSAVDDLQVTATVLDPNGQVVWSKMVEGLFDQQGAGHTVVGIVTQQDGALLAGFTRPDQEAPGRMRIVNLDRDGNPLWNTQYHGATTYGLTPRSITFTQIGGFFVTGNETGGGSSFSTFVSSMTQSGELQWMNIDTDTEDRNLLFWDVEARVGGGAAVLAQGFSPWGTYATLVFFGEAGEELINKTYDGLGYSIGRLILEVETSGYLLGTTTSTSGPERPLLIWTDADGNLLDSRDDILDPASQTQEMTVYDMMVTSANEIILVGRAERVTNIGGFFPRIQLEGFILKLDANGDLIWDRRTPTGLIYGVTETRDGTLATTGYATDSDGTSLLNVILFDPDGNIVN